MTPQEIFSTVLAKLTEQGVASVDDSNACVYRGPNNHRCAAGHLIPYSLYFPDMENCTITSLSLDGFPDWFTQNLFLIRRLQKAHDEYMPYPRCTDDPDKTTFHWRCEMTSIAERFNLKDE